ncbi:MAG: hypothetical protein ACRC6M_12100, partial [Microcystaceae cyanobacterium]
MNNSPMISSSSYDKRSFDEQVLYDHLLNAVHSLSPEEMLEDFRTLFIEARPGNDPQPYLALERLVRDKNIERSFSHFFNRCCHILVNHWQMNPQSQKMIPLLVEMMENFSPIGGTSYNASTRIRQLVKNFINDDQFTKIQRIASIVNTRQNPTTGANSVGTLINRYPYLYDYCLLGDDTSDEHRQTVRRIKAQTEQRFEVNLSR